VEFRYKLTCGYLSGVSYSAHVTDSRIVPYTTPQGAATACVHLREALRRPQPARSSSVVDNMLSYGESRLETDRNGYV